MRPPDMLLTEPEKEVFASWEENTLDHSLSSRVLSPLWELLANMLPARLAPNVISLAGLLCTIQAFYLCYRHYHTNPPLITGIATALVSAYQTLDALDGIHARRTMNASPVGTLWDHACDNVAIVFVALVGCYVTGITSHLTMWYIVQVGSLLLLHVHLEALHSGHLRYRMLTGPGEGIFVFQLLMISAAFLGTARLWQVWDGLFTTPVLKTLLAPQSLYYFMVVGVAVRAWRLRPEHKDTRNTIILCLLFRIMPALLYFLGWVQTESLLNVVCDGLFVSVLTTDVALCNMTTPKRTSDRSKDAAVIKDAPKPRQLHPWLLVFAMASLLDYMIIVVLVCAYYLVLFYELTSFLKLPMFTLAVNVYVDGVYDLCHVGHHNIFMAALQHGNRLFVGVLSDEAVAAYKRRPVMTMEERAAVVATCKGVYRVIKNAPCPGIPAEFLKQWNIHVVCLSTEYDKADDIYYALPRAMGITRVLPRTEGISTSDLIKRVKLYGEDSKQKF